MRKFLALSKKLKTVQKKGMAIAIPFLIFLPANLPLFIL